MELLDTQSSSPSSGKRESKFHFGSCLTFVIKACVIVCLALFVGNCGAKLPVAVLVLLWVLLSAFSSILGAYYLILRKAHRQLIVKNGSALQKINSGRIVGFVLIFLVSAFCMAALIFESMEWDFAEWVLAFAAIPLYLISSICSTKFFKQVEEPFSQKPIIASSYLCTAVVLTVVYILFSYFAGNIAAYSSVSDAFMALSHPLQSSPSILLSDCGTLFAFRDAVCAFALSKVGEVSYVAYFAVKLIMSAGSFFAVSALVGTCALGKQEIERLFAPLASFKNPTLKYAPAKSYVIIACVLPVLLFGAYWFADFKYEAINQTEECTALKSIVSDSIGTVSYVIDGKNYDAQKLNDLMASTNAASEALVTEATETLVPLIDEMCDREIENVDSYLDWYYSLPADYERLKDIFTGTVEQGVQDQLQAMLLDGVDDTEFVNELNNYVQRSAELKEDYLEKLSECELIDVPSWLIVDTEEIDASVLYGPVEPTEQLMTFDERAGVSSVVGAVSSIVASKVVSKALEKPVFKKIVAKLVEKLTAKGLIKIATAAASGAAGGTLIAPGVGTAVGAVAGVATTVGTDYLFVKADEAQNREQYKQELLESIEETRAEMKSLIQPQGE
jgi:hypothetical protein